MFLGLSILRHKKGYIEPYIVYNVALFYEFVCKGEIVYLAFSTFATCAFALATALL